MKKFLAILMTICLMVSLLCVPVFAAEPADKLPAPAADVVLRITANKGDDIVLIGDYTDFEDGWSAAMGLAGDTGDMKKAGYDRVIVKFYSDWKAAYGYFTSDWINDDGFKHDTICIPEDAKVTIDLNGHTINRNRSVVYPNGEVMYIDEDADVIIKNGTITGGWSDNGAGGIHVYGANVILENVNVEGNTSQNDDGGGIALYGGASLVMNGGSLKDNKLVHYSLTCYGGAIYAKESSVTLNNVEIKNNQTLRGNDLGAVIYADESTVVLNECTVDGNGIENEATGSKAARSIIHAKDSSITVKKTTFTNNGDLHYEGNQNYGFRNVSSLFYLSDSTLVMENGNSISKNKTGHIIQAGDSSAFYVSDTTFTDNNSIVLSSSFHKNDSYFYNCTFNNNRVAGYYGIKITFASHTFITENTITFYDCRMGNSTYSNPKLVRVVNENLESPTVLTLSALKTDGTVEKLEEYRSFEEGWNTAMSLANDKTWMRANEYESVVVDLHADWVATNGRFTQDLFNGAGFSNDTIFIPEFGSVILNMKGHTIDRGLTDNRSNGEVIYIMPSAKVTINNGTITGGYSHNGAGGIHVNSGVHLTLNNVHVDGNWVEDDDGAAMALYDATLVMNGGSISNNVFHISESFYLEGYGSLYLSDSTAVLNGVEIKGNGTCGKSFAFGMGIYVDDSVVTMKNCYVAQNVYAGGPDDFKASGSIIDVHGSTSVLDIADCKFENNGAEGWGGNCLLKLHDGTVKIANSEFLNNELKYILLCDDVLLEITDCLFKGNAGNVFDGAAKAGSYFASSIFSENTTRENHQTFYFDKENQLEFTDCEFGNSSFNDRSRATFDGKTGVGSIFGEGSLSMIVAITALIASVAAIFVSVSSKKKAVSAPANNAEETEDEE